MCLVTMALPIRCFDFNVFDLPSAMSCLWRARDLIPSLISNGIGDIF